MLRKEMDISRLMIYAEKIEEEKTKKMKSGELKKDQINGGLSFDSASVPQYHNDRVPNLRYQGNGTISG